MSRFDYVDYDEDAKSVQVEGRKICEQLEAFIDGGPNGRSKSMALTKLEECYMWIGKMIRDEQVARNQKGEENV